ncbi:MAG: shikimate dehydrogenase [Thermodesulfobacteriota bacterium]
MALKVFGLLSDHRAFNSKSPAMHNAVLRRCGLEGVYLPFRVEPVFLDEAVAGLRALGLAGANVTVPYKEAVLPFLDGLAPEAEAIGAVNTIVIEAGELIGHNTDAAGFLEALTGVGFEPAGASAVVLGAGGAAKAVAWALVQAGAGRVVMAGRDPDRTAATARRLGVHPADLASCLDGILKTDLLVNATSVSGPAEDPDLARRIEGTRLSGCRLVFDLNYGREPNMWRDLAAANRTAFEDGLFMLAHQARLAFRLWTGLDVEAREFAAALRDEP